MNQNRLNDIAAWQDLSVKLSIEWGKKNKRTEGGREEKPVSYQGLKFSRRNEIKFSDEEVKVLVTRVDMGFLKEDSMKSMNYNDQGHSY